MTFVRRIKVKGRDYIARVKNYRQHGTVKQKVIRWYGKATMQNRMNAHLDDISYRIKKDKRQAT